MSASTTSLDLALAHARRLLESDPALAAEQGGEILRVVPGHPAALLLLGAAHNANGQPRQALAVLAPLAQRQPRSAGVQLELGIALDRIGRMEDAREALERALALDPALPGAWLTLGDHLCATGDHVAAATAYDHHVRHAIRDPELMQAAEALSDNRLPEAEAMLRARLRRMPTDVAAIRMFAELAARLGRHEDAEHLLERCLELAPGFHAARQNYAQVLHRANKPTEALEQVEMLLQAEPANPGHRNLKAVILCRIGDYATALDLYGGLLAQHPHQARIWLSYGHALKTAGHQDRAVAAYRRSIELEPGFGDAYWSLANLKTFRFTDADLAAMRAQLARDDLDTEHRFHFEFALGKALEDAADHAASFRHYQQGNALRRGTIRYSADATHARVDLAKRLYTRAFFEARAGTGSPAPDPIFIVGLPRAGSTLIEQILSSHSAVEGTMELPEITTITRRLRRQHEGEDGSYHAALAALDAGELRALGEEYLARTRVQRRDGTPLFIDKMPNNFLHVGLIHLALPNARIIDARRHPLACCFSGYKQHFASGQHFTYGLEDIGRYYRDYVELMAHFDDVLPGRVHRVIYEEMVDDTEAQVRRLLHYCGLPFEEQCLRFFENTRAVRTASSEQVRQPIYRDGVDHWRHYEAWLDPLKAALGTVLDAYPAVPEFATDA